MPKNAVFNEADASSMDGKDEKDCQLAGISRLYPVEASALF